METDEAKLLAVEAALDGICIRSCPYDAERFNKKHSEIPSGRIFKEYYASSKPFMPCTAHLSWYLSGFQEVTTSLVCKTEPKCSKIQREVKT